LRKKKISKEKTQDLSPIVDAVAYSFALVPLVASLKTIGRSFGLTEDEVEESIRKTDSLFKSPFDLAQRSRT
jgi:hypothetical protein